MTILDNFEQGSDEWLRARLMRITATDASKIMTAKARKPSASWPDLMAMLYTESQMDPEEATVENTYMFTGEKFIGNKYTDHGNEFEPVARKHFANTWAKENGIEVREVGLCVHENRIWACSPDALLYRDGELVAGWEAKCKTMKEYNKIVAADGMPDEYKQQVHWSMIVTGLSEWHFYAFFPHRKPKHIPVYRDDYTEDLERTAQDFLLEYADYRTRMDEQTMEPEPVASKGGLF